MEMEFVAVLEVSSIIWDKDDYQANTSHYYNLVNGISAFIEKIEKERPKVFLRDGLIEEMIYGFPFDDLPNSFYSFGNLVYSFLGKNYPNFVTYPEYTVPNIKSIPNLIKTHYNDNTKSEVGYLISKIHSDSDSSSIYFTFSYLYNNEEKLKTLVGEEDYKEYETIISDRENELENFFSKFRPIFEHNPKHDKTPYNTKEMWDKSDDKSGFISRLSCYYSEEDQRPQEILDRALKDGNVYFSFDDENEVWVIFRCHKDNKYHGYDEYNLEKIPEKIRQHFNK